VKPSSAHNALTSIEEDGKELEIVRDNMPFGEVGKGEFGTYFIGYARSPRTIEQMLVNMFVGRPPGNYDRLLDYSRAVTGTLFFVPSATFLENIEAEVVAPWIADLTSNVNKGEADSKSSPSRADGSLNIGSLKKEERNE
jgi:putative iron-dependent peroxidase